MGRRIVSCVLQQRAGIGGARSFDLFGEHPDPITDAPSASLRLSVGSTASTRIDSDASSDLGTIVGGDTVEEADVRVSEEFVQRITFTRVLTCKMCLHNGFV